jgi:folate-dependent phosphoribosylglycinamide formyltransferase PurN
MRSSNPGIRGGIAGSSPVWGDYIRLAIPNWAAKFFIDALLDKEAALASLPARPRGLAALSVDVPTTLPQLHEGAVRPPRVVVLATPSSRKAVHMMDEWPWGFKPSAVVLLVRPRARPTERLRVRLQQDGIESLRRVRRASRQPGGPETKDTADVRTACRKAGIHTLDVDALDTPEALGKISALEPDLFVFAGGAILREPLLKIPRLGTLNAHMGLLPFYRGMNVVEWACFHGDAVGCSVHLIDTGIDTGDILCVRPVPFRGVHSVYALRERVDAAQMELLGEVVRYVTVSGQLPPRRRQSPDEGRQFFRMHHELVRLVEQELASDLVTRDHTGPSEPQPAVV